MYDDGDASEAKGSNHYQNRAKKQRRNRFLHNAKGFGRKGGFGRGAELNQDQYNYLVNILEAMSKEEDVTERQLMANNVLRMLAGKEIKTASNQLGSRVLENLLAYTDEETFAKLMDTFTENFRVVCCDQFASHVLQRMLYVSFLRSVAPLQNVEDETNQATMTDNKKPKPLLPSYEYSTTEKYDDEHRLKCQAFVERLAKFVLNNLEEFIWNNSSNYVVRQCMLNLSGIPEMKMVEHGRGRNQPTVVATKKLCVPEKWQKLLNEFTIQLMAWPQFVDLPYNELSSIVLQSLLRSLASTEYQFQLEQLCSKLHNEAFLGSVKKEKDEDVNEDVETVPREGEGNLKKVFQHDSSIRLLEVYISLVPSKLLKTSVFEGLFRGHLKELSLSRACNFAVQKLIDYTGEKDVMETILVELEQSLEDIMRVGHTGIVLSLAKTCARLACQQGKFVKLLLDALHCTDIAPENMLLAVLHLLPADVTPTKTPKIDLHGSLILQAILEFNKPIKFVSALLEMPNDRLANILSDPRGSFIANAFVGSRFVGEKSREKMVRHLEGQYSQLLLTSHGSRVVEIMYEAANPAQRESIVRELAEQCSQLTSKPWFVAINKRLLVDTYKQDPARWKVAMKSDRKVEKMFGKLIKGGKRKAED